MKGGACPGTHQGTSWPVLLNVSCHKKHEYIWFRDGAGHAFGAALESWISFFKLSCKTLYQYLSYPKKIQNNPSSGYWEIVGTNFGWFWARLWASLRVQHFQYWKPVAELYIHTYHIPKFQNNPFSGYWDLVWKIKGGWKWKNNNSKKRSKNNKSPHFVWET